MNVDRLITMLARMLMRKGMNAATRSAEAQMTPEERAQSRKARQTSRRARQAMRVSRKIGRF